MWITKIDTKKYQYVERYTDPLTGQKRRVSCILPGRSVQHQSKASVLLAQKIYERTSVMDTSRLTVGALGDMYVEHQKAVWKPQTAKSTRMHINRIVDMLGKETAVDKLTAAYIVHELEKLEKPSERNGRIKYIKAMFRWAYQADIVQNIDFIKKLAKYKDIQKKEKLQDKYLEKHELDMLMDGMKEERWRLATKFLALSGIRVGEFVALNKNDIDDRYIHIDKTFSFVTFNISSAKTDTSNRDVYIRNELKEVIKEINEYQNKQTEVFGYKDRGIWFANYDGGYIGYAAFEKYFKENSERILGRPMTIHSLRHTYVALMSPYVDLDVLSRQLGHADSQITKSVYFHVTNGLRDKDEAALIDTKIF